MLVYVNLEVRQSSESGFYNALNKILIRLVLRRFQNIRSYILHECVDTHNHRPSDPGTSPDICLPRDLWMSSLEL